MNPTNYRYKVIKIFNNSFDKILYESFLHQYFNVKDNSKFINKSNCKPTGFDTTGKVACYDSVINEYVLVDKDTFDKSDYLVGNNKGKVACIVDGINKMVSSHEFYDNEYNGVMTGKVACYDIKLGKSIVVSKDIFDNDKTLVGLNKGMVVCLDVVNNIKLSVTKEEFDNNPNLVGNTFGCKLNFTEEHKKKISDSLKNRVKSEEHKLKLSASTKGRVSCLDTQSGKMIKVTKEEFDNNPNLVGTTKNIDKYIVMTPEKDTVTVVGKKEFYHYCMNNKISYNAMIKSFKYNTPIRDSNIFYNKSLSNRIKNGFGYQLIGIEEF